MFRAGFRNGIKIFKYGHIFCVLLFLRFGCEVRFMTNTYITISHLDECNAADFCNPGTVLKLRKEPNRYDDEAIAVYSDKGSRFGYVANSCSTVAHGTHSAGYIYRDFDQECDCVVRFRLEDTAIAELVKEEVRTEN